jgi:hypothetical protein
VRSLPIGPQEAFLLSRIDGSTSERDIVMLTGFDATTVSTLIDRLHQLGAIVLEAPPKTPADKIPIAAIPIAEGSAAAYDPRELESPADLDLAKKREILDLYARLEGLSYYELLGVPPQAEKKDLRRGYYARAPAYHPDKFFGKNLGTFKSKMESIFGKLTVAYETLSSPDRRAEYDGYLCAQRETETLEQLLHGPVVVASAPAQPVSASTPAQPVSASTPAQPEPASTAEAPVAPTSKAPLASAPPRTAEEGRARREALARKLRSSLPPDAQRTSVVPTPVPPAAALKDLVRRRDAAMADGHRLQLRRYVEAAKAATQQNNPAAAANAYRLALAIEPDDPELIRAYQETAKIASAALADGYLKQADYEARTSKWTDAARSYARAAAGMPHDPEVQRRAADALLQAGGDLHAAVDFAQRAIALAANKIEPHLTLADIYLAAGRGILARREIDAAREIDPQDDRIKVLSRKLR